MYFVDVGHCDMEQCTSLIRKQDPSGGSTSSSHYSPSGGLSANSPAAACVHVHSINQS